MLWDREINDNHNHSDLKCRKKKAPLDINIFCLLPFCCEAEVVSQPLQACANKRSLLSCIVSGNALIEQYFKTLLALAVARRSVQKLIKIFCLLQLKHA